MKDEKYHHHHPDRRRRGHSLRPTEAVYNKFVNEITMDNKGGASQKLPDALRTPGRQEKLESSFTAREHPSDAAKLNEDFAVNLDITVKK